MLNVKIVLIRNICKELHVCLIVLQVFIKTNQQIHAINVMVLVELVMDQMLINVKHVQINLT